MQLGPELLVASSQALEHDREGESDAAFADCLDVLFQALDTASLSPADQIEWAIDMEQADEYSLCHAGLAHLWKRPYAKSDWSAVCDRLAQRLEAIEPHAEEDAFLPNFKRSQMADWLIRALEKAGRQDEGHPAVRARSAHHPQLCSLGGSPDGQTPLGRGPALVPSGD